MHLVHVCILKSFFSKTAHVNLLSIVLFACTCISTMESPIQTLQPPLCAEMNGKFVDNKNSLLKKLTKWLVFPDPVTIIQRRTLNIHNSNYNIWCAQVCKLEQHTALGKPSLAMCSTVHFLVVQLCLIARNKSNSGFHD